MAGCSYADTGIMMILQKMASRNHQKAGNYFRMTVRPDNRPGGQQKRGGKCHDKTFTTAYR